MKTRFSTETGRLEAFSDGVIAVVITIMVLELKPPHGTDLSSLRASLPTFAAYVLSFVFLGIYWNNHHHLLRAATLDTKQYVGHYRPENADDRSDDDGRCDGKFFCTAECERP